MSRSIAVMSVVFFLAGLAEAAGQTAPLLPQQPTISRSQIVFVYAGDLWSVSRDGGAAARLTAGTGVESSPRFSPDGTHVAFTGEYDGNTDVFVVPAQGGVPKRLTWHPAADTVLGWTPDGKRIVFSSGRDAYSRFAEIFTVAAAGGTEEKLPLPMGYEASYSPDAARLAYCPMPRAFTAWKRYRGGQASPIWIATLASSKVEKIPREKSNDVAPMWVGDKIYFLSDRNGPFTLFSYDLGTKKVAQAVENNGLDFKSASAGPDAIVYEQFGALHTFDLKTGRTKAVPVTVAARPAGGAGALRPGRLAPDRPAHLPGRHAGALRSARRDPDGSRREGGRPQPDEHAGRHGARAGMVARRQDDRLLLGRGGRICAAPSRAGRHRHGDEDRLDDEAGGEGDLLFGHDLVARQQEDRIPRQASHPLVRGPGDQEAGAGGHGDVFGRVDARLVARLQVDRLRQAPP